jgi:iron complex transport system ATP-binding protein
MGDVLDLIGVTVVRNETTLLDEVTWTVREGERWVLLGPNGAGKTTLLQIAGARLHPSKGTARILDETLGTVDVFELRPRIGLSSAAFAETLPANERVADVVLTAAYAVAGRWHESYDPLDHRRSTDLLAAFGVAHLADRTFGTLSEGERKRVQLARSLMTDPELVLLDEPAAGLDLGGRETLVQDLSELARDRRSPVLVLVTHHVEEIPPGFTHALLLRQGRVVAAGPIDETLTDETLTAAFDVPLAVQRTDGRWTARIRARGEVSTPRAEVPPTPEPVEDALGFVDATESGPRTDDTAPPAGPAPATGLGWADSPEPAGAQQPAAHQPVGTEDVAPEGDAPEADAGWEESPEPADAHPDAAAEDEGREDAAPEQDTGWPQGQAIDLQEGTSDRTPNVSHHETSADVPTYPEWVTSNNG